MDVRLLSVLLFVSKCLRVSSASCPMGAHQSTRSSQVTLHPNCSVLHPEVSWTAMEQVYSNLLGVENIAVQYSCTINSTTLDLPPFRTKPLTRRGQHVFSDESVELPIGAHCVFSGWYTMFDRSLRSLQCVTIDSINCTIDIDECSNGQAVCPNNSECVNTIGSFDCLCADGYIRTDDGECQNVDECTTGNHECHERANCTDTAGGYQCTCVHGYHGDGFNCTNINECETGRHHCYDRRASCVDTEGSYLCHCSLGYLWNGEYCEDINECDGGAVCMENAHCVNTHGSYDCECSDGYVFEEAIGSGSGSTASGCINVNECEFIQCRANAYCLDTVGSYECTCLPGYLADSTGTCSNIDECEDGTHQCGSNQECTDTEGSYDCMCSDGYILEVFGSGDGSTESVCINVNECEFIQCQANAHCSDTVGSYECTCLPGYHADLAGTCSDIDECEDGTSTCDSNAQCRDTEGSFECSCNFGFNGDGERCSISPIVIVVGSVLFILLLVIPLGIAIGYCIVRQRRRTDLNRQLVDFFPWANELNTNFIPVDAKSPVHYSPSIQSTFESLEKTLTDPQSDSEDKTGQTQSASCSCACLEVEPDTGGNYELHSSFYLECDKGSMTNLQLPPLQDAKLLPKSLGYSRAWTKDGHRGSVHSLPERFITNAMAMDECLLLPETKDVTWHEHHLVGGYLQENRPEGTPTLESGGRCEDQLSFLLCNSHSAPLPERVPATPNNPSSDELCRDIDQLSHDILTASFDGDSGESHLQSEVTLPSDGIHSAGYSDQPSSLSTAPEVSTQAEGYLPHTGLWLCHSDSNDSGYGCARTNSSSSSSYKHGGDMYDSEVFSLTDHGDGLWSPFSSSPSLPTSLSDTDCCFNESS